MRRLFIVQEKIPCLRRKSRKTYPDWPHVPIKHLWESTSPPRNRSFTHIEHRATPVGREGLVPNISVPRPPLNIYFRPKRVPVLSPTYSLSVPLEQVLGPKGWHRTYPIGDARLRCRDAPLSARHSFVPLQKSRRNHRSYCERKPYPVWFSCRRKSYPVTVCHSVPETPLWYCGLYGVYRSVLFCGI